MLIETKYFRVSAWKIPRQVNRLESFHGIFNFLNLNTVAYLSKIHTKIGNTRLMDKKKTNSLLKCILIININTQN